MHIGGGLNKPNTVHVIVILTEHEKYMIFLVTVAVNRVFGPLINVSPLFRVYQRQHSCGKRQGDFCTPDPVALA